MLSWYLLVHLQQYLGYTSSPLSRIGGGDNMEFVRVVFMERVGVYWGLTVCLFSCWGFLFVGFCLCLGPFSLKQNIVNLKSGPTCSFVFFFTPSTTPPVGMNLLALLQKELVNFLLMSGYQRPWAIFSNTSCLHFCISKILKCIIRVELQRGFLVASKNCCFELASHKILTKQRFNLDSFSLNL